jgi:hypothetical protein
MRKGYTVPWAVIKYRDEYYIEKDIELADEQRGTCSTYADLDNLIVSMHPDEFMKYNNYDKLEDREIMFDWHKDKLVRVTMKFNTSMMTGKEWQKLNTINMVAKHNTKLAKYMMDKED